MRKRRWLMFALPVLGLAACINVLVLLWWWKTPPAVRKVRLSRETTYILEPVTRSGLPDYRRFLRARQLGSHPKSSNALLDLYAALGPEAFRKDAKPWAKKDLGLEEDNAGTFVRTEAYARSACQPGQERCAEVLEAAVQEGCKGLSREAGDLAIAWVAANERAFDLAQRASEKPVLYVPVDEWATSSLDVLALLRLQRALACRGTLRRERGEHGAAAGDVVALWKLGELARANHNLLLAMVGFVGVDLGSKLALSLASSDDLPPTVAGQLLRSIPIIDERSAMLDLINYERIESLLSTLNVVHSVKHPPGGAPARPLARSQAFNLETMLQRVNETFDMLETAANTPTPAERAKALSVAAKVLDERRKRSVSRADAVVCVVPFARKWCNLDEHFADIITKAFAHTQLSKIRHKISVLDDARRALLEARDRNRP